MVEGKLESDVLTIYNYIDSLSYKVIIPMQIDPVYLRTILNNVQKVISKCLDLPS